METLALCALVCKAFNMLVCPYLLRHWECRGAILRRGSDVELKAFRIRWEFDYTFPEGETSAQITPRGFIPPLSQFFFEMSFGTSRSDPRFSHLTISDLDLSREHPFIHRTVRSLWVTRLDLCRCMTQSAAQLGRFIISFPSLRVLNLSDWSLPPSGLQDIRVKAIKPMATIRSFDVCLVPNISALLDYCNKRSFFGLLKSLHFRWEYTNSTEKDVALLRAMNSLLHRCSYSLESLTMTVGRYKSGDLSTSAELRESQSVSWVFYYVLMLLISLIIACERSEDTRISCWG